MNASQKSIALALTGAFALTVGTTGFAVEQNPFAIKSLSHGYQVAEADTTKMKDGKCSTGKCGANKKKAETKAKEGSCSAEKMKDGNCSAEMKGEMKAKEGNCSADKMDKMKDGSCHADKK